MDAGGVTLKLTRALQTSRSNEQVKREPIRLVEAQAKTNHCDCL
jgi:hypothetical protein